jgi:diguanylate cyclase (GGDEF)-like protein
MVVDTFVDEDFRVLASEAFDFILSNELKRAVRSQNFVTLVILQLKLEEAPGDGHDEHEQATRQVARLITREMRETDLVSHTARGELSVVLLDAGLGDTMQVIQRLMSRLDHFQFSRPLTFAAGAACCPTHGADADTLRRTADPHLVRKHGDRFETQ